MNIRMAAATLSVAFIGLLPAAVAAEGNNPSQKSAAGAIKETIDAAKQHASRFEESFERALDRNPVNGSDLEDRLNNWADFVGDQLDKVADDYSAKDMQKATDHFENALIAATGINRFMLRADIGKTAASEWAEVRRNLNRLAVEWRRPVVPNLTVAVISEGPARVMNKPEMTQALGELEDSVARFNSKFEEAIRHYSTVSLTPRENLFTNWSDDLEDASDQMLEERREKDAKEFQQQLENTLVVASAINRIMLRSDLDKAAHLEWKNVREHLNQVAQAFGRPVLPDMVANVQTSALR